jgi:hypothetical protein
MKFNSALSRSVTVAAAVLIGLAGCHSWRSGSTQTGDSGSSMQSSATGSSTRSMNESQVRRDLSDHGYNNVSSLHQSGSDWVGSATDTTGQPVNFDVDDQGVIVIIP